MRSVTSRRMIGACTDSRAVTYGKPSAQHMQGLGERRLNDPIVADRGVGQVRAAQGVFAP
jgi:hypothetical protein